MSTTVLSRGGCGDEAEKRSAACNADLRTISPLVNLELNGNGVPTGADAGFARRTLRLKFVPASARHVAESHRRPAPSSIGLSNPTNSGQATIMRPVAGCRCCRRPAAAASGSTG